MNDFQCWRNATDKHSQRHISYHLIDFNTPLAGRGVYAHRVDVYDSVIPLWTFLSIILESYPESSVSVSLRIRRSFMKTPKVYVTLFWKGRQINAWLWRAISKDHIMTSHPRKKLWYFVCLFVCFTSIGTYNIRDIFSPTKNDRVTTMRIGMRKTSESAERHFKQDVENEAISVASNRILRNIKENSIK